MAASPRTAQLETWHAFARMYPEAASNINEDARAVRAHNGRVATTRSHGEAAMSTRCNSAAVLRSNIASGYAPENLWESIARQWRQ